MNLRIEGTVPKLLAAVIAAVIVVTGATAVRLLTAPQQAKEDRATIPAASAGGAGLLTVSAARLAQDSFELLQPVDATPAFSRESADEAALDLWPSGSVRESVLVRLRQNPQAWAPDVGDVWLVSVTPARGAFPTSHDGGLKYTFVIEIFDARSGAYIGRYSGA